MSEHTLTKDEWAHFFNLPGWQAFMAEVERSLKSNYANLCDAEGTPLYRAQGVQEALKDIRLFPEMQLNQIYEGQRPEPTEEEERINVTD